MREAVPVPAVQEAVQAQEAEVVLHGAVLRETAIIEAITVMAVGVPAEDAHPSVIRTETAVS